MLILFDLYFSVTLSHYKIISATIGSIFLFAPVSCLLASAGLSCTVWPNCVCEPCIGARIFLNYWSSGRWSTSGKILYRFSLMNREFFLLYYNLKLYLLNNGYNFLQMVSMRFCAKIICYFSLLLLIFIYGIYLWNSWIGFFLSYCNLSIENYSFSSYTYFYYWSFSNIYSLSFFLNVTLKIFLNLGSYSTGANIIF